MFSPHTVAPHAPAKWTTPHVDEIKMDAEIGSYEVDDPERDTREPFARVEG